jgi:hypothetical protein
MPVDDMAVALTRNLLIQINEADLYLDYDYVEFHNEYTAGVWASGVNTTTHVNNFRLTSIGANTWGIVASNHSTVVASNVEMESNHTGSCGFVAHGGSVSVDYSVVYADGSLSAGVCVEPADTPSGMVHARGVTSSSLEGVAVWLYGAAGQISFTNCTLVGGGDAAIISTSRRGGLAEPRDLNIIDSIVMATNPDSPVLHYAVADSNTHIYNSTLISASPDLVVSTCSPTIFENCTTFYTNISISESEIEGNIQAWEPSRLRWELTWYTRWTGSVVNTPSDVASSAPDVYLDGTSVWTVTEDTWVRALVSGLGNVSNIIAAEPNVTIRYDGATVENAYLSSQTFEIEGGGSVQPYLAN